MILRPASARLPILRLLGCGLGLWAAACSSADVVGAEAAAADAGELREPVADVEPEPVRPAEVEGVRNVHRVGDLWTAGQPSAEGLGALAEEGVVRVIDLREPSEVTEFDEPRRVRELGMEYANPSFGPPDELTPEVFGAVRALLREGRGERTLLHCGSANRVGAVWLAARVLDEGVPWRVALGEAREIGLRTPGYVERARDYVRRAQRPEWADLLDEIRARYPDVERVSADELEAALAGDDPPLLLDVRAREEFEVSRLPGALHAPHVEAALERLAASPKDRPIVVYCSVGYRSSELARRLAEHGFTDVRNLEGSIFEWANEGRSVHREGTVVREVHPYDRDWGRFLDRELWPEEDGE